MYTYYMYEALYADTFLLDKADEHAHNFSKQN